MKKVTVTYRKNGLYEVLVARAIEGLEVEHLAFDRSTTEEDLRANFLRKGKGLLASAVSGSLHGWDYNQPDFPDMTINRSLFGKPFALTLDCIIANAILKDFGAGSQKELCADLFAKVKAMTGQPPRVIIVTDNLEDHAYSVKNEADTACQFWTNTIVQAVGTQPTMMSYEEYKNSSDILDWEWVLVDRHMRSRELSCPWGLVFYIPIENLLESLVALGIAPSGSWQDKAVEAIRSNILSKVNS